MRKQDKSLLRCPECGNSDVELYDTAKLKCNKCGKRWKI